MAGISFQPNVNNIGYGTLDPSQGKVLDRHLTAPPGAPAVGTRYIVASVATGAWAGKENYIAEYSAGLSWDFTAPTEGMTCWIDDENVMYFYDGSAWDLADKQFDHGLLKGLTDDDHTQYHNDTRGDARYYPQSSFIDTSAGVTDAGKPIKLDSSGRIATAQIGNPLLNQATNNEVAFQLNYTVNKVTSGNDSGLVINMTDTNSPGTSKIIDLQKDGVSKFSVSETGAMTASGTTTLSGTNYASNLSTLSSGATFTLQNRGGGSGPGDKTSIVAAGDAAFLTTAGNSTAFKIAPIYNQASGNANNRDLWINRTETAIGSGAQLLIDASVGEISKFNIDNSGNGYLGGKLSIGHTATPAAAVHLDQGTAVAIATKYTAGTTTGQLSTDGFDVGISATGVAELRQRENLDMVAYTNNAEVFRLSADGKCSFGVSSPRSGVDLGGKTLVGTGLSLPHIINKVASANTRNSHNDEKTSTSATYTKVKTITITNGLLGQQRFVFDVKNSDNATTVYARIYKNGVALGTEQNTAADAYATRSEDISQDWSPGDTCELWVHGDGAVTVSVRNFQIAYDDAPIVAVASVNS